MRDDRSGTLDRRGSRTLRRIVCVALFALALMPAGANGAVAGQSVGGEGPGPLVYAADPGEANRLTISHAESHIVFTDTGATIRAGHGCTADTPNRVSCEPDFFTDVRLEDGDDEASSTGDVSEGARTSIALHGDQGNDTLHGSADVSTLDGGAGRDVLAGGTGTTYIQAADILWFAEFDALPALAPAHDEVSCAAPNPGASGTHVDAGPDDAVSGPCGPVATYGTDVIDVRGTEGPDQLGDRIGPTRIEALGGDDIVQGGERADGGPGNDRMLGTGLQLGGPGDDRLDVGAHGIKGGRIAGQDGNDFITGSDGPDSLTGGAGRDRISGRGGNDTIRVRDGERDSVRCGDGHDTVLADRIDTIGRDCERTSRTASAATASQPPSALAGARAASGGCGQHTRGATILTRTQDGVVFKKRGSLYGCLESVGSPHPLPNEGGGWDERGASAPRLSGRYVAFATFGSAIGDEFDRIYVYDLRLAAIKLHIGSNRNVTAIAVKRNGSVGWIESPAVQSLPEWEVHKAADDEHEGNVLLARAPGIDPASLAPPRTERP